MNAPPTREAIVTPVDLSRTEDFALGSARVRASAREIEIAGKIERLQPRVMQVLVALARAQGAVVSRDDLIEACWEGLAVGEDAINRVIGKIRRLAEGTPDAFAIETVSKVGYRLIADPSTRRDDATTSVHAARQPVLSMRWRRAHVVVAAAVAVVAAVGGSAIWFAQRMPRYVLGEIEMAVHSRRKEMEPTLSPDGRFLVYAVDMHEGPPPTDATRRTDLYMRAIGSDEEIRLTNAPQGVRERLPAFSPSGRQLAYVRITLSGRRCQIVVRDFPQGMDRVVGACKSVASRLAWTRDDASLIYSDVHSGTRRIRILDLRNGRTRDLVPAVADGWGDFNPSVSPDGRRLSLVRYSSPGSAVVYVYDLESRKLAHVTPSEPWAHATWADNHSLFVAAARGNTTDLWRINADGSGRAERLVTAPGLIAHPAVAAGVLAIQIESTVENLRRLGPSGADAITSGNQLDHSADFAVDGRLAFISDDSRQWLYLQEPGASARRLVELRGFEAHGLRWSPDGRRLVYAAAHEGRRRIFIVDSASGVIQEVPLAPDLDPDNPAWSADGRQLLLTANDAAGPRIVRARLDGGGPLQSVSGRGWVEAIETQEGVFARSQTTPGVWRLARERAADLVLSEPPLWRHSAPHRYARREWAIAVGRVYALDASEPGRTRVISRSLAGGAVTRIGEIRDRFAGSLTVNPRTGEIVYAATVDVQSDIAIVRLYRR